MRFRQIAPRSRQILKWAGCLAGMFLAVTMLAGCGGEKAAAQGKKDGPPALVRVAQLKQKPISRKIIVVGNVTPVRTSVVASGANGVVKFLHDAPREDDEGTPVSPSDALALPEVEQGQFVTEGTVLSVLRMETANSEVDQAEALLEERKANFMATKDTHPADVAHAEAMIKMAQAVESNARTKFNRAQNLYSRGAATDAEFEDARERLTAASEALVAAEKKWASVKGGQEIEQAKASRDAQAAQVKYLTTERDKRTTKAPFDGFIVEMHTYKGQWLSKGDPVATLAKMDEVDVIVNVDQADLPYVRFGQTAQVMVEGAVTAKGEPKTEWTGEIVHIVPQSDWEHGSRGFPVVVRIHNKIDDAPGAGTDATRKIPVLKAGMLATVTILAPEVETLLAHKDALVRSTEGNALFLFEPKDKTAQLDPNKPTMGAVRQIWVEPDLGLSEGEYIGIRPASGQPGGQNPFKAGQWVVTEGGERLRPIQDNVNALRRIDPSSETGGDQPD